MAGPSPSSFEKVKELFRTAVKRAVHLSAPVNPPYFIFLVGLSEVCMHVFATKALRQLLIYDPKRKCELWRFVTYMMLHRDYTHLVLNIGIQSLLASPLESEQGHSRTAGVYFGGAVAGSLGASIFDDEFMLVGASGGIYALLISQIPHIILNYKTLKYVAYRWTAVTVLVLADVAYVLYHVYMFNNESPRIGVAAHFSGAASGFLLGGMLFKGTLPWRIHLRAMSTLACLFLLTYIVGYNAMRPDICNPG